MPWACGWTLTQQPSKRGRLQIFTQVQDLLNDAASRAAAAGHPARTGEPGRAAPHGVEPGLPGTGDGVGRIMSSLWQRLDAAFAAAFAGEMGAGGNNVPLLLQDVAVNEIWNPDKGPWPLSDPRHERPHCAQVTWRRRRAAAGVDLSIPGSGRHDRTILRGGVGGCPGVV